MSRAGGLLTAAMLAASFAQAQSVETAPPFVTTPETVVDSMLELAQTGRDDVVIDLGSGDGRIVIAAARIYGARAIGVELDPKLVDTARESAQAAGVGSLTSFLNGDVLKADLSKATVVTAYLLPWLMDRLQPKFLAELAPGTRIVSHAFPMSGWEPDTTRRIRLSGEHEGRSSTLYYWMVPAQVRGEWRSAQPESEWRLEIRQNFQEIEISAAIGETPLKTAAARLRGTAIEWESEAGRFTGRVLTFQIVGSLTAHGASRAMVFTRPQ